MGATPYRLPGEVSALELVVEPTAAVVDDGDEEEVDVAAVAFVPPAPSAELPITFLQAMLLTTAMFMVVGALAYTLSLILRALQ